MVVAYACTCELTIDFSGEMSSNLVVRHHLAYRWTCDMNEQIEFVLGNLNAHGSGSSPSQGVFIRVWEASDFMPPSLAYSLKPKQ